MTRQAFEALSQRLVLATEVQDVRLVASFTAGTMQLECNAPNRADLEAWMTREHLHPSSLMRLDIEASESGITAL